MKKSLLYSLIIGSIILIFFIYWLIKSPNSSLYNLTTVEKRDLISEVYLTGRVKPTELVSLAFEKSGRLNKLPFKVGDSIKIKDILAVEDNLAELSQLKQAQAQYNSSLALLKQYQASLDSQKIKLEQLKTGARLEEITLARINVTSAEKILEQSQINLIQAKEIATTQISNGEKSLIDAQKNLALIQEKATLDLKNLYGILIEYLRDAYSKSYDSVYQKIDTLYLSGNTVYPQLIFLTSDNNLDNDLKTKRANLNSSMDNFNLLLSNLNTNDLNNLDNSTFKIINYLYEIRTLINLLDQGVTKALNLSSPETYRTNLYNAQTNINTVIYNINNQKQLIDSQKNTNNKAIQTSQNEVNELTNSLALTKINTQNAITTAQLKVQESENSLNRLKQELKLKEKGTPEDILLQENAIAQAQSSLDSQKAIIAQAQASVMNYQAQISKTILRSPLDGIITKIDAKIGEIITPNLGIISVMSENELEIEASIPEVDIPKIKIGDKAKVTLDAYSSDLSFEAQVIKIDPAETMIEGVPAYKTTFQFLNKDERIKSGMTANLTITIASKLQTLAIPQRAIIGKNGSRTVEILNDKQKIEQIPVSIGITSSDGYSEVISGLKEKDIIILSKKN